MTAAWPPPFTLRKSARAKRASIRISVHQNIEVVVPARSKSFDPIAILNEHKDWVLKQLAKTGTEPVPSTVDIQFPSNIAFPALGQQYQVIYQQNASTRLTLTQKKHAICLSGDAASWPKVQNRLIKWLNDTASDLLPSHLSLLANQSGLQFETLVIRHMKTRWGSCSQSGQITLNSQLLFLPLSLIHHVILHELCHTRYMSHGPRFWGLLAKLDPDATLHNAALKNVQQYIPAWCAR